MLRRVASGAFALVLMLIGCAVFAAELKFPALTGRVVDDADILSGSTKSELDAMLAQHERTTGDQIVVATLESLQGHSIEDYGYQLGRAWGIGQKGKNNGVILIVAPQERKTRIEVGYGLEGRLTDAQSRVIIEEKILPRFRNGDFNAGVLDGTAAILRTLGDETAANMHAERAPVARPESDSLKPFEAFLVWLIFAMAMLYLLGRGRRVPYIIRGPYSRGWGGGSSSGGSSGGGFSGGGGSFGGGGASGGW